MEKRDGSARVGEQKRAASVPKIARSHLQAGTWRGKVLKRAKLKSFSHYGPSIAEGFLRRGRGMKTEK